MTSVLTPQPLVTVVDSLRGGYLDEPDIETGIIAPSARVQLVRVEAAVERILELSAADVLIAWHHIAFDADVLRQLPRCRGIVRASVGYDNIDIHAAGQLGITVCNVPDYGVEEVADHTLAMMLALVRKLPSLDQHCRSGGWDWRTAGHVRRLRECQVGIVGFGRIGASVARRLLAFGAQVRFFDPYVASGTEKVHGVRRCASLRELLSQADIVTIHVPLTSETAGFIGQAELAQTRPGAMIVNTSRGDVIDQRALITALTSGHLGQAALDVLQNEPHVPEELRTSERVLLTPHSAFFADASLLELRRKAAEAAVRILNGEPVANRLTPLHAAAAGREPA